MHTMRLRMRSLVQQVDAELDAELRYHLDPMRALRCE
jgi:hypothetical protein